MAKTIKMSLSTESIESALRELEAYQRDFDRKCDLLRERVAAEIRLKAEQNYDRALGESIASKVKDSQYYSFSHIDVDVRVENGKDLSLVIASGEEVVFVEFGAGVTFNGVAGSSPHPMGEELNMLIGEYGKKQGRKKAWAFKGEDGRSYVTFGTPASQSLYNAVVEVAENLQRIAREVFND